MNTQSAQRRFDLDWLRVLAILTVFVYHTTRFFNSEYWHVKNPTSYLAMDIIETTLANWVLAVIFAISGASLFYAIGKGTAGKFIKDKILRLGVPFVVMGTLIFGIPQIYLERLSHGEFSGSLLEFVPSYFQPGNFAWTGAHLWYLEMLFVFCLVLLPILLWLKRKANQRVISWLGDLFASKGALYLIALPTILSLALTRSDSFLGDTYWGGGSILSHATFLFSGFLIASHEGLQKNIQCFRWLSLVIVVVLFATLLSLMMIIGEPEPGSFLSALGRSLWGIWSWSWALAIFGFGMKHLTVNRPFLAYANEAVLPFYILHQPVLLGVGYFVVQWNVPALLKFLIIDVASFSIIMGLYEYFVRRVKAIRFLFGMKPSLKAPVFQALEAEVA